MGQNNWSEKQRKELAEKCSKRDSFVGLLLSYTGFKYNEFENVVVRHIHNGQIVDSFIVNNNYANNDTSDLNYGLSIGETFYLKDSYQFIIKGYEPYILSDMKLKVLKEMTMYGDEYGCYLNEYRINGELFQNNSTPEFIKEGYASTIKKASTHNNTFNPPRITIAGNDSGNITLEKIRYVKKFEIDTPYKIIKLFIVRWDSSQQLILPFTSQYLNNDAIQVFQHSFKEGDYFKVEGIKIEDMKGNRYFLPSRTFRIVK